MALCSDAEIKPGEENSTGEPTECALVNYANKLGMPKYELEKANALYNMTHKTKESIATEIDNINGEIKAETANYNDQIRSCKPRYLRPTAEEEHEEKLLMLRQKEIDQLSSGGR